jgi:TonB family protein
MSRRSIVTIVALVFVAVSGFSQTAGDKTMSVLSQDESISLAQSIVYPEFALRCGIQGRVYVKALITEDGKVASATIQKGLGFGCDEAALTGIKRHQFTKSETGGHRSVLIPVRFKLSS